MSMPYPAAPNRVAAGILPSEVLSLSYLVRGLIASATIALALAAPVAAAPAAPNEEAFVRPILTRYVFLDAQHLLSEGYKICSVLRSGIPSSDATMMVRDDLGVSVSAAGEIVSAASLNLGC
jgi:hypothetical protein